MIKEAKEYVFGQVIDGRDFLFTFLSRKNNRN
jgi:hypothetical protein